LLGAGEQQQLVVDSVPQLAWQVFEPKGCIAIGKLECENATLILLLGDDVAGSHEAMQFFERTFGVMETEPFQRHRECVLIMFTSVEVEMRKGEDFVFWRS
jgi:hypothetical protein